MARKKKRRIPKTWIVVDKQSHTISTRNPETGKLTGRKFVKSVGQSDRTRIRRISKGKYAGQLLGRTPPIKIRASKKARAHLRRRL